MGSSARVIRLYIILLLTFSTGCGALTNFIVGASGNVLSDSVDRAINNSSSAKEMQCGGSE